MTIKIKYFPLLIWMLIIFLLSSEVADTSSGRSDAIVDVLTYSLNISWSEELLTFLTRKAAHIIAYFILGMLIFNVIKTYKFPIRRAITVSITLAFTYATTDEIHQLFVPGRSGELRDVLIDTSASMIGIFVYYYFSHKIRKNSVNSKNKL
jgi:VanZ family protein